MRNTIDNFTCSPPTGDPRESMRRLPRFIQPLLTLITGKPLHNELSWQLTPWHHLIEVLAFVLSGAAVSFMAAQHGGGLLALLPMSWLVTLHGMRKIRTIVMHQCAHSNFCRHRTFDRWLGKAISIVLASEEFDDYKRSHCGDHHSARHQTVDDPTVAFLLTELGLRPGMSRRKMWYRLLVTIASPAYHARFLVARLWSHFAKTSMRHRCLFVAFWSAVLIAVGWLDAWTEFVTAWLIPAIPLYQVSAAFRLASKHVFPVHLPDERDITTIGVFTLGIFLGDRCPSSDLGPLKRIAAWVIWWARLILIHLPFRLAVLVGDGPTHDYHHRHPNCRDWPNYIHNRAADASDPGPGWPPYREVWGLCRAIDACFQTLSEADPAEYAIDPSETMSFAILAADD